jgi:prefoldin subunit 5
MDFCFNNLLMKKLRSFEQNSKTMNQELKKLKERIEELNSLKTFNK